MDNKTTAGLIHLLGLLNLGIVSIILWVVKKDESELVDQHGKTFLNLAINLIGFGIILGILFGIAGVFFAMDVAALGFILYGIGILASIALGIFVLVFMIKGAIAGFKEESFQYPYIINIIK